METTSISGIFRAGSRAWESLQVNFQVYHITSLFSYCSLSVCFRILKEGLRIGRILQQERKYEFLCLLLLSISLSTSFTTTAFSLVVLLKEQVLLSFQNSSCSPEGILSCTSEGPTSQRWAELRCISSSSAFYTSCPGQLSTIWVSQLLVTALSCLVHQNTVEEPNLQGSGAYY